MNVSTKRKIQQIRKRRNGIKQNNHTTQKPQTTQLEKVFHRLCRITNTPLSQNGIVHAIQNNPRLMKVKHPS